MIDHAALSSTYLSSEWPTAGRTAPWHKENTNCTNWLLPHYVDIDYSFNSKGYRDIEWTAEQLSGIWCIGDSQTVGIGVASHQLWSQCIGHNTVNLGIAGASNDTMARILCSCMSLQRPTAVFVLLAAPNRREIINQIGSATLFPHSNKHLTGISMKLFEEFLNSTDSVSDQINRDKNILLMKFCCQAQNVPIVIADFDMAVQDVVASDRAADNLHIGPQTHRKIADFFQQKLLDFVPQ